MAKYVIEHLEKEVYPWCVIEYRHISATVGRQNLIFTNVSSGADKLKQLGEVHKDSATKMKLHKACILDPEAPKMLTPEDAKQFDYFIFGGILGDDPPQARTKPLLTDKLHKAEARNLGKEQMSTDTAVAVVKKIVDGTPLDKLKFTDKLVVEIADGEEIILPYKYLVENGKALVAPGLIDFLKENEGF